MMIYGYIRVSTEKQTPENQRFEIQKFCETSNVHVDIWIEETISTRSSLKNRKLGELLKILTKGDILIATELSRLGRNLLQVMAILQLCLEKDCQIWTIKERYRLGTDITSKILAFAFSLSAEIERQLISQRTKEALHRVKCNGQKLGRPYGNENSLECLKINRRVIIKMIRSHISKTQVARMYNVSRSTIDRLLRDPKSFR